MKGSREAYLVLDQFLDSIYDYIKPLSIKGKDVSGLVPPICRDRLFCRRGVVQVTLNVHKIRLVPM